MSTSKGITSEISKTSTTIIDIRIEVGTHHYIFCHNSTPQSEGKQCVWVIID